MQSVQDASIQPADRIQPHHATPRSLGKRTWVVGAVVVSVLTLLAALSLWLGVSLF
jgi:hypothetical protein